MGRGSRGPSVLYGQPAPEGPHPRLQSGAGQRGRLGTGWGADLQTHHRGTPGEDPQGACITLLTQPCPQRRPRLPGGAGQAPARPTSATGGRQGGGWCRGRQGRISWGREWGAPEKGGSVASSTQSAQEPHTQPGLDPRGQRTAPSSPWRLGGRPVPTQPRGTLAPPRETDLAGAATTPTPTPASGPLAGVVGPRTPSSGPPADKHGDPGCETGKRTTGSVRPCKEALRDPAQDAGPAGPGRSPTRVGVDGHTMTACLWEPPHHGCRRSAAPHPRGPRDASQPRGLPAQSAAGPGQLSAPRSGVPTGPSSSGRRWASLNMRGRPRPLLASRPLGPPGWSADLRPTRDRAHPAGLGPASAHCTGWKVWGRAGQDHVGPEAETRTAHREHGGGRGAWVSLQPQVTPKPSTEVGS